MNSKRRSLIKAIGAGAALQSVGYGGAARAQAQAMDLVVFLPGIMGSVLQKNGKDVWAVTAKTVVSSLARLERSIEALQLAQDAPDVDDLGDGIVASGLIPDVHLIPGFWKIDGYSGIREALAARLPVQRGLSYIEFPYDWRRDNRVAARRLAREVPKWLARWRASSGDARAKVVFIAHSMGGLIARYYLECLEGWRYTRKLITFGTPYRGSLNAVDFLSNGYKVRFAGFDVANLSALLRTFTSVYQLMPRYPCVDMGDGVLRRPGEVSGLPNINPRMAAAALAFHYEAERAICRNKESREYERYGIHPIIGIEQSTRQLARLRAGRLEMSTRIGENDYGGDGTVPRPSAVPLQCSVDEDRMGFESALHVPGVHGSLQNLPEVVEKVAHVLRAPDFGAYRSSDPLRLDLDDAYHERSEIQIRCSVGNTKLPIKSSLVIEDAATGQTVARRSPLLSSDRVSVNLGPMSAGLYRAVLRADSSHAVISDVFLVSQ